jgi:hypothetical protein
MGRTRRCKGPRPQLHHTDLKEDTLDRLHRLKKHRDEPIYDVADRASQALDIIPEVVNNLDICRKNISKLHPIITNNGTAIDGMLEHGFKNGFIFPSTLECFSEDIQKYIEDFYNKKKQQIIPN